MFVYRVLILLSMLILVSVQVQAQSTQPRVAKRVALLIGNATYPGAPQGERKLNNPVKDAQLLGQVLKDELKFDEVQVLPDLKAEALDSAITRFIDKAAENPLDTIIIYFSGHGIFGKDRHNYLLGIDANTGAPNRRELKWQGVRAAEVRDRLKGLNARVAILVLDACRSGPGRGKDGDKALRYMGHQPGVVVAYATAEGEIADDGNGSNSPYAEALARAWRNSGLSVVRQLDEVADEVKQKVPGQQPMHESTLRSDVYMLPERSEIVQKQHAVDWELCKTALSVVPCEQYRSKYPKGEYIDAAGTRLADIRAAQVLVAESGGKVAPALTPPPAPPTLQAGQVIKDCDICPELVVIPGGEFVMGDNKSGEKDEKPAHKVKLASFLLGKFEVTQGQWRALMGSNPSYFKDCGDNCPVENVSWNDAQKYVAWLNAKTRGGYRLPSEAEWEYAARAGSSTKWHFGDEEAQLGRYAWYSTNAEGKPHAVGGKQANPWGLHDTHGNVWEWVEDCGHESYQGAPVDGSAWLENCLRETRVLRGGSWFNSAIFSRAADRFPLTPDLRNFNVGLRVARTPR